MNAYWWQPHKECDWGMIVFHNTAREARYLGVQNDPSNPDAESFIHARAWRRPDSWLDLALTDTPHAIDSFPTCRSCECFDYPLDLGYCTDCKEELDKDYPAWRKSAGEETA